MTLEWRQHEVEKDCWVTACGRYCVSYDNVRDTWRAWKLVPGGAWFAPLRKKPMSENEAKLFCAEDSER